MTTLQPVWAYPVRLLLAALLALLAACGGGGGGTSPPGPTPVSISTQPISQTVVSGAAASFAVTAAGDSPAYQWQLSVDNGGTWANVAGATTTSYAIATVDASMTGRQFRVTVSGSGNSVTSSAVTLTVTPAPTPPAISVQPADVAALVGGSATFNVTATGTTPAYQWQSSPDGSTWTNLVGATAAALTVSPLALTDSGRRYRVVVSNTAASVNSNAAVLTVTAAPAAPQIGTQPQPASVTAPQTASFSVVATGTPAPAYQWQQSSNGGTSYADITGATASSYTTPATVLADSGKLFRVHVSNSAGDVFSNGVLLTVAAAPVAPLITAQPLAQSVTAPATATFAVAASGTPTPTYQWQQSSDGGATFANVNGATAASYTTPATAPADSGKQFRAVATNSAGSVNSNAVTLTVSAGTMIGVAATGSPIVGGSVQVVCAAGPALSPVTSGAAGAWQTALVGQTLPCAVRVSGGTVAGVANTTTYTSVATAVGTANVTPLTDLLVANLVGSANPAGWFGGLGTNPAPLAAVTAGQVSTALGRVAAALSGLTPLATTSPVTTAFTPVSGNISDDMLTALARAQSNAGVTYAALLGAAAAPSFTAPGTLGAALATAYASAPNLAIPSGPGGSNTAGMAGSSLVLQVASGTLTGGTYTDASNFLLAFGGMGSTATVPYSAATGLVFYGALTADRSGNLWAVRNTLASVGGYQTSLAIVKFVAGANGPADLTPTVVVTLPAQISVNYLAFDSSDNLWLDEIDLNAPNTGAARIVQYTASSGYTTIGTVISYSGNGGWDGGCEGAALAFGTEGHLHTLESYSDGIGHCVMRAREYTLAGVVVPSKYFPNPYVGSDLGGDVVIDAAGNLWVFSASSGCTSAALSSCAQLPSIRKIGPTGLVLQTIALPNVQETGRPAIDANGNLWFGGNVSRLKYCSGTSTQYVYELVAGANAPTVAYTHTSSCTSPLTYYFGIAVSPRSPNLP
jgi:hypothetical protein